jgi:hypothetical protein
MWTPPDTRFHAPSLPVALARLPGAADETRALLEALGCVVLAHRIATPGDLLQVLGQGETAPRYLVIDGHGTEAGLWFGAFGTGIDTALMRGEYLPWDAFTGRVHLPGCTVVAACCYGGNPRLVQAMLTGGAVGCIASPDAVDGRVMTVFLVNLFYALTGLGLDNSTACRHAVAAAWHEDLTRMTSMSPASTSP